MSVVMLGLSGVYRGSLWLYLGGLLSSFLGYVYWFTASSFISPGIIGSVAAVTSLYTMLISVFSLGIPTGLQRFIGLSKGRNDYKQLSTYFFTSLFFTLSMNLLPLFVILVASFAGFSVFNLASFELIFVAILILLDSWSSIFTSLFRSLLRIEVIAFAQAASSLLRLFVGILLLYLGFDFLGVMLGLIIASLVMDALLLFYAVRLFREFRVKATFQFSCLGNLLKASLASWVPSTLTILVQSVGVLSIYVFMGGAETGLYYMAFAIASIVYNFPGSVLGLMFPVLSGMEDGKKRAISRAIKLSAAIVVPLALGLALYPSVPLSLLGAEYIHASDILRVLALGAIISPIFLGYTSYIYAIGRYLHVGLIGLLANGSRLILYVLLIPSLDELGVATAYTFGFFISLAAIIPSAFKTGYKINWLETCKIIAITILVTTALSFLNLHWLIGVPALLLLSMITYTRLGIVTKSDLLEVSQAFLSKDSISKVSLYARPIIKLMYGE